MSEFHCRGRIPDKSTEPCAGSALTIGWTSPNLLDDRECVEIERVLDRDSENASVCALHFAEIQRSGGPDLDEASRRGYARRIHAPKVNAERLPLERPSLPFQWFAIRQTAQRRPSILFGSHSRYVINAVRTDVGKKFSPAGGMLTLPASIPTAALH